MTDVPSDEDEQLIQHIILALLWDLMPWYEDPLSLYDAKSPSDPDPHP